MPLTKSRNDTCGQGLIKGITEAYDEPVLVETVTKANDSGSGSGS